MSKRWVFFHHKSKAVFLTQQARYLLSILPEYSLPGYGKLLHETQSNSPCLENLLEHEPPPTPVSGLESENSICLCLVGGEPQGR
jgi:hypothetical protein